MFIGTASVDVLNMCKGYFIFFGLWLEIVSRRYILYSVHNVITRQSLLDGQASVTIWKDRQILKYVWLEFFSLVQS
jgi:hypothetical protein